MASQKDVAEQFARGVDADQIPDASNFYATSTDGSDEYEAVILSYGWAVVFGRKPDGTIVEFTGWRGYSVATSSQMGKARNQMVRILGRQPEEVDKKPEMSSNPMNWRVGQSGAEPL